MRLRAELLAAIRQFFAERNVLEVDTPTLTSAGVTDAHLTNFQTTWHSPPTPHPQTLFLQTSPEYAMKRLLAAGSGCIYQLGKAYRNEESGRFHNPEFTLLEWYRCGFDMWQLMDETAALLTRISKAPTAQQISYQHAFQQYLHIDPLTISLKHLKAVCTSLGYGELAAAEDNSDTLLQLLFSHQIETQLPPQQPLFVYHFPASQAALAKLNPEDPRTALRFELYWQGIELANGFDELTDPNEQLRRFQQDLQQRRALNIEPTTIDYRLLAALASGLPECSGVALGVDRLLMLVSKASHIQEVLSFTTARA